MGTVNKSDLIRDVASATGATAKAAQATIEAFIATIASRAEAGDTVRLPGFGSFQVKARAARTARNPGTGLPVDVPESRRIVFKAAKKTVD